MPNLIPDNARVKQRRLQFSSMMASSYLFIALAFIYPIIFLFFTNYYIYTNSQIWFTLLFLFIILVPVVIIIKMITVFIAKCITTIFSKHHRLGPYLKKSQSSEEIFFVMLIGSYILLLLFYPIIREKIINKNHIIIFFLVVPIMLSTIFYLLKYSSINIILVGLTIYNGTTALVKGFNFRQDSAHLVEVARSNALNITFKQKPNVYLIILESYNSMAVRDEMYGIDNALMTGFLSKNKFKLYENAYSNYFFTLASLSSVFLMDHHFYKYSSGVYDGGQYRNIIGGNGPNPVLSVFLKNGYKIDYTRFDPGLYTAGPLLDAYKPPSLFQPLELCKGLLAPIRFMQQAPWGKQKFQPLLELPNSVFCLNPNAGKNIELDPAPKFTLIYTGAFHSFIYPFQFPSSIRNLPGASRTPVWKLNGLNEFWKSLYKKTIQKTDKDVVKIVENIIAKDPEGLIIMIGDHGAWMQRDRWIGESNDVNENMTRNGVAPRDVSRDLFEVLMAIRWPGKQPNEYFTHVNLFREVFAVLAENESILKSRVPDESYAQKAIRGPSNTYRTVKDGKPLDRWELIDLSQELVPKVGSGAGLSK